MADNMIGGWLVVNPRSDKPATPSIDAVMGRPGAGAERVGNYGVRHEAFGPIADELIAGVSTVSDRVRGAITGANVDWASLWRENLDVARRGQDKTREEFPVLSLGSNIVGGMAALPLRGGATALTTGQALMQGAKAGGLFGAGYGFAEGRDGFMNRAESAVVGSAFGAGLGTAFPLIGRGIGIVAKGVSNLKGLKGPAADRRAQQMMLDALEKDGLTLADLQARANSGKPVTAADLGPNTRALLASAGRQSDEARKLFNDFYEGRTAGVLDEATGRQVGGQYARLSDDLGETLGVRGDDFTQVGADVTKRRADAAGPGYAAAYAQPAPPVTPRMKSILETPDGKRAVATATRFMANKERPMTDAAGNYTVEALDQIQRAMRDASTSASGARKGELSGNIGGLRDRFLAELPDDLKGVMANYRSESELVDAMLAGRSFLRGDSEAASKSVAGLSQPELEMFRLGAARELLEKMGGRIDSGDVSGMFQNENMRRRLLSVFPDEKSFAEFMKRVQTERTMQDTRNEMLKGSQTAVRRADDEGFVSGALGEAAIDVATGAGAGTGLMNAVVNLGRGAREKYLEGIGERVGGSLGRMGVETDLGGLANQLGNIAPPPAIPRIANMAREVGEGLARSPSPAAGQFGGGLMNAPAQAGPQGGNFGGWIVVPQGGGAAPQAPAQGGMGGWQPVAPGQPQEAPQPAPGPQGALPPQAQGRVADLRNTPPPSAPIEASSPYQLATMFVGKDEKRDAAVLSSFIKNMTGKNLDPAKTAWCAAFVNSVLAASGSEGTGRLNARSFLDFGTETQNPKRGDVAVFWRESPDSWKGHVGFYAGEVTKNGQKYIRVLGGNQDNAVSEKLYPASQLLSVRRPPVIRA